MMTTLREMPKPNRASHGGKGLFVFAHRHCGMYRTTLSAQLRATEGGVVPGQDPTRMPME